jgi:hypothetical protein
MIMVVSALGDSSNIDNLHSSIPAPNARLVPHDNNIGQRDVSARKRPRKHPRKQTRRPPRQRRGRR